jgi:superfamily II DNA or RNA helicase
MENALPKLIILSNKKCQAVLNNEELFKKLHRFLSFKAIGVEYTAAFQSGWSGFTYLLSKAGKFDLGLLEKVKAFLDKNNVVYEIEDKRPSKILSKSLDLDLKLKEHNLIPREHQERVVKLIDKHEKGIVRAATGSGKTLITALVTAKLNKPTIIYVIGLDLLDQFHKLFSKLFEEEIGYIGNGVCNPKRITIASIWTIGKALSIEKVLVSDDELDLSEKDLEPSNHEKIRNLLKEVKVHILDESHVVTTSTINEIYKNIDPEYIYGFSGTPFRDDGSDLQINGILGEQIINVSASELIKKELLAQPIIKFITVPKMKNLGAQYLSVYKDYIVENEVRNNLIVKSVQELLDKKYTPLVLFKQIKHGEILLKKLQDAGIRCLMLDGSDSLNKRNEIKDMLINKEIDVVLASTIFDIGLDLPILSGLVLCGGGKSSIRALQRIGRVLRLVPGKKTAAIVDFFDQAKFLKKHSQIRCQVYSSEDGFKIIKSKEMK